MSEILEPDITKFCNTRILITDDEENVASLMTQVIEERFKCSVSIANGGEEAIQILEANRFDILITDMQMPGMHGLELISRVTETWPEISVIAVTGYASEFPYVRALRHGAADFINKPFPPAELEAKLLRILRERELRVARQKAERKYRSLFELSADGMVLLSDDLHVEDTNQAFRQLSGRGEEALNGQRISEFFGATDRVRLEAWMRVCAQRGSGTMADMVLQHPDGTPVHADVSASFIDGDDERIILLAFKDVTEKRQVDQRLQDAAQRDELTGLLNKRSFNSRFEGAMLAARRGGTPLALCLLDLDNFKRCNDTHGHQIGDKVLVAVGEAIKTSIRVGDEGFRFGGDEFAVLLRGAPAEAAVGAAERMQAQFGTHDVYGTSMSVGVAMLGDAEAGDALIKRADEALYAAKNAGKNAVRLSEV